MSTSNVTLIIVGLNVKSVQKVRPEFDEAAYGKIVESMKKLDQFSNLTYHIVQLDTEAPAEDANSIEGFYRQLHNKSWSAVLIGGGIRALAPMTQLLEEIVNEIARSSSGKTKILFSADGSDHQSVMLRHFPELNAST
ncbi:hypothetical protein AMS68_003044 [Peltaster fructicola]|uniref:Uncharacterized protein n=1 Tax=Peltaster fructicola TaxID=286661 RepID=A0A6H0XRZ1_9PEZI|nr:hypothetical protein AMS68_003044 [Peltaster fructicola]